MVASGYGAAILLQHFYAQKPGYDITFNTMNTAFCCAVLMFALI